MKTNLREETQNALPSPVVSPKVPGHPSNLKTLYQLQQEAFVRSFGQHREFLTSPQLPCQTWDLSCSLQGTVLYTYAPVDFLAHDL